MIRREIKKNDFNKERVYINGESAPSGNPDDVQSVEVVRGGNSYDTEMINSIITTYVDGTIEVIDLIRGVTPQVPDTVPDHEYINHALITGFSITVTSRYVNRKIIGELVRENGYGKVLRLNMTYPN